MKKSKSFEKKQPKLTGLEREGLLIAHYGHSAEVEDQNDQVIKCHIRKNTEPVITGDRVLWIPERNSEETGIILAHLPRKSLLSRREGQNKIKPLAANIDALIIVTAPNSLFEHLIDRFLVASEHLGIHPIILFNKSDLLTEETKKEISERLKIYEAIGYPILFSNTVKPNGLDDLNQLLQNKNCVLVGASGVGKSSIIASVAPNEFVRIGETSQKGQGKHTTTITRLYHLSSGGSLIDSPGVREFGLWHMSAEEILSGFIEFKPFLNHCKFRNCKHGSDTGCALQDALVEGKISEKRYQSYCELIKSCHD